ncbi:MAG: D-2-hydroxyacid dehydrogenase [Symbiobacteriia bacterium]
MQAVVISKQLTPQANALRATLPGWDVAVAEDDADALRQVPDADVVICWGNRYPARLVQEDPNLRWIQALSAGVDGLIGPLLQLEQQGRPILLTNARGAHGEPIAEHVLGMILAFTRGLLASQRAQSRSQWIQFTPPTDIAGLSVGIVGFGSIGQTIAAKFRPLGMQFLATRARPEPHPFVEVLPPDGLERVLRESDVVIIAAPATHETQALIGAAQLSMMKRSALLVNIARGSLIDEAALLTALEQGTIAGAALDVFDQEPLPPSSPLWQAPNLLITPHIAGISPSTMERTLGIVVQNLKRFQAGQPLFNLVDKVRGY